MPSLPGELGQQEPVSADLPAVPSLAAAGEAILAAVNVEKAALQTAATDRRAAVLAEGEARAVAAQEQGQGRLQALAAQLDGHASAVRQGAAAARAAATVKSAQGQAAAGADAERAVVSLGQRVTTRRTEAVHAAEDQARGTDTDSRMQAQRVQQSAQAAGARVRGAADREVASKPADTQGDAREAVMPMATQTADDMRSNAADHASGAISTGAESARNLRKAGTELAAEIGKNTAGVETSLRQAAESVVQQVAAAEGAVHAQVQQTEAQALAGLAQMRTAAETQIRDAAASAALAAMATARQAVAAIDAAEAAGLAVLDRAGNAAMAGLHAAAGAPTDGAQAGGGVVARAALGTADPTPGDKAQNGAAGGGPDEGDVAAFTTGVFGQIKEAGAGAAEGLDKPKDAAAQRHDAVAGTLESGLAQATDQLNAHATLAVAQTQDAGTQATAALTGEVDTALATGREAHTQAVGDYDASLAQHVAQGKQSFIQQRERTRSDVSTRIDDAVAGHTHAEARALPEMATAATKATETGIWAGIKRGLGRFLKGLLIFLAAVLVIAVGIWIIAAIIGVTIAASEIIGIALLVAGAAFLIYGFFSTVIQRAKAARAHYGQMGWGKALGLGLWISVVSLGQVFGVTQIIEGGIGHDIVTWEEIDPTERAAKVTEGILTLLTIGLFKRASRTFKPPPGWWKPGFWRPPAEPPPVRPPPVVGPPAVDPNRPPAVDPNRPPEVDPNRPPEVDPNRPPEVDPNRPPAYDPTTRTDAELQLDSEPDPRVGETPDQALDRAIRAEAELRARRTGALPERPPSIEMAGEDARGGHTIERHGPQIPLERQVDAAGQPNGTRTIEGRVYGDPPWGGRANKSAAWSSMLRLNQVVNRYLRGNWDAIRTDLINNGEHNNTFEADGPVGDAYINTRHGAPGGAQNPVPARVPGVSRVTITIVYLPGGTPPFFILRTFPNPPVGF